MKCQKTERKDAKERGPVILQHLEANYAAVHNGESIKIRIFNTNTNVKSVLYYGSETWRVTKTNTYKFQAFTNRCLRNILNIRWPEVVPNNQLWDKTGQAPIEKGIEKRKWAWIRHTLRKPVSNVTRKASEWNPQGNHKVGRSKQT